MLRSSRTAAVGVLACATLVACSGGGRGAARPPSPAGEHPRLAVATRGQIGRSARGRPIYALETGTRRSGRADILVVGCIHGDEPAGRAIVPQLRSRLARQPVDAWLIPDLNPDGVARGTRQNARGVDLNRNFPWHWHPLGPRGTQQYAGPRPLSEPETRAAAALVERIRPRIAIWFHQPLGVVDESGGQAAVERRFSRLSGLPLRRLTRYPGSAVNWENRTIRGSTAFVVELPPGALGTRRAAALATAVARLAAG